MRISMIAAVARNRVIGKDNQLIWHMPEDLKFFKKTTLGHPIIMGRNTFQSFGKPLPGRTNIVLSASGNMPDTEGVHVFKSLEDALRFCQEKNATECFIAGGQKVYELSLPFADRLIITEIHETFDGDTYFPEINTETWKEVDRVDHKSDEKNPHDYSFVIYERRD